MSAGGHAADPGVASATPAGSLKGAFGRLSIANAAVLAAGLVTGPLLARALGADGRGTLAAIVVPLTIAAWIAGFGLGPYVAVEVARHRRIGTVLGTTAALSVGLGVFAALVGVPVASLLAGGDKTVFVMLVVGFGLLPVTLPLQLVAWAGLGLGRWNAQFWTRVIPPMFSLMALAALYASGALTVVTAACATLLGGFLACLPFVSLVREARPLGFDRATARASLRFGSRAWVANLAALTNARLDQLLMVPLVERRQLGLYVVAVTFASLPSIAGSALNAIIVPRVARGDRDLVARALRLDVAFLSLAGVVLAALAPLVIPLAFGSEFRDAVEMAWLLLAAGVPFGGSLLLMSVLTAIGRPGAPAMAQAIAGAITVVGLLLLLPSMGALGAAAVSLVAYSAAMLVMLRMTMRALTMGVGELLLPRRGDLSVGWALLRAAVRSRALPSRDRA